MYNGKKVSIVMPAYNAEKTLELTFNEIDFTIIDHLILVDDYSQDQTSEIAEKLGIFNRIKHDYNKGYWGNQKTCYDKALELGSDIIIMLHPDYQYTPKLIPSMVALIGSGLYDVVFASRILGKGAIKGGMPLYKYAANRALTFLQNILMQQKLSEYHTGYRAYSRKVLEAIKYHDNSDDFIFDNEIIAQIFHKGYEIAEITCPTKYFKEASSINFSKSVQYGIGVLRVSTRYLLHQSKLLSWKKLS